MLESRIQRKIVKYLEQYGIVIKLQGSRYSSGWPDLLFLGKNRTLFVEVKKIDRLPKRYDTPFTFDSPVSKLQHESMLKINQGTHANAYVVAYVVEKKKWIVVTPVEGENYLFNKNNTTYSNLKDLILVMV